MVNPRKLILHCPGGYRPELEPMIDAWIRERVEYVGIVGRDVETIYRVFEDKLCSVYHPGTSSEAARRSDGSDYFMWPMAHADEDSLRDAIDHAHGLTGYFAGPVTEVVEF